MQHRRGRCAVRVAVLWHVSGLQLQSKQSDYNISVSIVATLCSKLERLTKKNASEQFQGGKNICNPTGSMRHQKRSHKDLYGRR